MNSNSWETFFYNTNKLSKPAQAKQLISKEDISEIELLLISVLNGYLANEELNNGLKIYIDNELRNDLIAKMAANPPKLEYSLESWTQQIFGDQKFGIILMGLEQYSNSFAEKAATIVHPLIKVAGLPLHGLSFLFFMGNYGFTPFGIHKDAPGEDGILFHLGPANKQFYTWDDPKYNAIEHHSKVFHNVSEMLTEGKAHDLEPGDAMFIAHYVYHIANSPKFSVSVVLDYINPSKDLFENELIKETAEENLMHQIAYEKPIKLEATESDLNELINLQSIQRKMQIALERKMARLKSNGGIRRKSNKINTNLPATNAFSIKGKKAFPLYLDDQDPKNTLLFARGHRIVKQKHPELATVIDRLNRGEAISLSSLTQLMDPTWDLVETFGFIQELLSADAIVLV
ncbi:MAG: RNA methylase [Aequorivita antarctica]